MISLFQGFIPASRLMPNSSAAHADQRARSMDARTIYQTFTRGGAFSGDHAAAGKAAARQFLNARLQAVDGASCDLPSDPAHLEAWMRSNVDRTGRQYQDYLARRQAGGAREYFHCRSHALGVLRAIAPTKLVDGAWLYGTLSHAGDHRLCELARTYVEELGEGAPDKNHVLLYRRLLQAHEIDDWETQPEACFEQGAVQLALAASSDELLPEVVGFNLGYEQLPLHLLITAYELDELGLDPYYFTLHVTVDNAASGHAMRAVKAVHSAASTAQDAGAFWERVRRGYKLNELGTGTTAAIANFDLHREFLRVLGQKTVEGRFAHSNYCRIEGRTVNEWLAGADGVQGFVDALQRKGWLAQDSDPRESRFWQLLHGQRAKMFGVFGAYERQVIYDWIRGRHNADGAVAPATDAADDTPHAARPFRHQRRESAAETDLSRRILIEQTDADAEVAALIERLTTAPADGARLALLRECMEPARHWTNAGLRATRIFRRAVLGASAFTGDHDFL